MVRPESRGRSFPALDRFRLHRHHIAINTGPEVGEDILHHARSWYRGETWAADQRRQGGRLAVEDDNTQDGPPHDTRVDAEGEWGAWCARPGVTQPGVVRAGEIRSGRAYGRRTRGGVICAPCGANKSPASIPQA